LEKRIHLNSLFIFKSFYFLASTTAGLCLPRTRTIILIIKATKTLIIKASAQANSASSSPSRAVVTCMAAKGKYTTTQSSISFLISNQLRIGWLV
jgi:hypothetical protein